MEPQEMIREIEGTEMKRYPIIYYIYKDMIQNSLYTTESDVQIDKAQILKDLSEPFDKTDVVPYTLDHRRRRQDAHKR